MVWIHGVCLIKPCTGDFESFFRENVPEKYDRQSRAQSRRSDSAFSAPSGDRLLTETAPSLHCSRIGTFPIVYVACREGGHTPRYPGCISPVCATLINVCPLTAHYPRERLIAETGKVGPKNRRYGDHTFQGEAIISANRNGGGRPVGDWNRAGLCSSVDLQT